MTPRKRAGQPTGRRRFDGALKDVAAVALLLGTSEKAIRSQTARGLLPHRRLAGRVVYLQDEIVAFLHALPGVTSAEALHNIAARTGEEAGR